MFALRQADTGVTVAEVCRKMCISEAIDYKWKKKYGGLGVPELQRLKQLEEENQSFVPVALPLLTLVLPVVRQQALLAASLLTVWAL